MAIMLVGVITAGIVGAFMRVESESRIVNSADTQDPTALEVAQTKREPRPVRKHGNIPL